MGHLHRMYVMALAISVTLLANQVNVSTAFLGA